MNQGNPKQKEHLQKSISDREAAPFPIVGIGASAGGLEVLEQFFTNMPETISLR
jgi:chemotaxis response regulator CheB